MSNFIEQRELNKINATTYTISKEGSNVMIDGVNVTVLDSLVIFTGAYGNFIFKFDGLKNPLLMINNNTLNDYLASKVAAGESEGLRFEQACDIIRELARRTQESSV